MVKKKQIILNKINKYISYFYFLLRIIFNLDLINKISLLGIGDWGLGIGDWGLGVGANPQSPIPNPQSPITNPQSPIPNPQKLDLFI